MRVRKVNRYYCDFCKKANLSRFHMANHERGCTLNPARVCGVCKLVDDGRDCDYVAVPLADMVAMLPDPQLYPLIIDGQDVGSFDDTLTRVANAVLPALRNAAGDCPACVMAAIRQRGIPMPMVTDFNWTKEMADVWASINDAKRSEY